MSLLPWPCKAGNQEPEGFQGTGSSLGQSLHSIEGGGEKLRSSEGKKLLMSFSDFMEPELLLRKGCFPNMNASSFSIQVALEAQRRVQVTQRHPGRRGWVGTRLSFFQAPNSWPGFIISPPLCPSLACAPARCGFSGCRCTASWDLFF